jgi:parallel beta-helix repeat protein
MATTTVSTASQLSAALSNIQGDTTIILNKGSYGALKYSNVGSKGDATLKAAAPGQAVFEDLQFHDSKNVTIDGLAFKPQQGGGEAISWGLSLHNSANMAVVNSAFSGEAGSLAKVIGVRVKGSSGVTIENNTFTNLQYGVQAGASSDLKILDNSLTGIRADGFQFTEAQKVEIARNFGTDFSKEPGAHPDFIQFHTAGTSRASAEINIHDNVFLQGQGSAVQGVFMGNEAGITYQDVAITNNLFYTSYWNGILVAKADGVVVDNNTVLGVPNNAMGTNNTWIKLSGATNARVTDNLANSIDAGAAGSNNTATHWQSKGGTVAYAEVFADAWAGASASLADFQVKSAHAGKGPSLSSVEKAGAGASKAGAASKPAPSEPAQSPADTPEKKTSTPAEPPVVKESTPTSTEPSIEKEPAPSSSLKATISGTESRDGINGTSKANVIVTEDGNDIVNAGDGNDILVGGLDKDWLCGQGGDDVFVYTAIEDSGASESARDVISAWGEGAGYRGNDTIDLRLIDANAGSSGHQTFEWIGGEALSGKAGELRAFFDGENTIVEGTVNADKAADFQIQISGKIALTSDDFLL